MPRAGAVGIGVAGSAMAHGQSVIVGDVLGVGLLKWSVLLVLLPLEEILLPLWEIAVGSIL